MSSEVLQIKERLSIVDVVGGYVKLDKAGINFRGRCPFHNEKTPSFFVSPTRQSYHCFGCNKGGDIFTFIQDIEGHDFPSALKLLADRAGVKLEYKGRSNQDDTSVKEKNFLKQVLEIATRFYQKRLTENKEAIDYLKSRGLNDESILKFRLGLAPAGWSNLLDFCLQQKINPTLLDKAGLVVKSDKNQVGFYDRFRSRIMFPIMDSEGGVVGFSGRIFGESETEAKYVNTSQTLLYDKSRVLYGFDLAKTNIRRAGKAVLVEGQMDLVMSHQVGVENTIAVSGTALTEQHLIQIKRLASKLVMAFDSDLAGVTASKRALLMALKLGFDVEIASLPDGLDPADLAVKSAEDWKKAVEESVHVIDFYLSVLVKKHQQDKLALGRSIKEDIYPLVATLAHRIDKAHFVSKIAEVLDVSEDVIWQDLEEVKLSSDFYSPTEPTGSKPPGDEVINRQDRVEERLVGIVWWYEDKEEKKEDLDKIKSELERVDGEGYFKDLSKKLEEKKSSLLLEIDILYQDKDLKNEFDQLLVDWQTIKLKQDLKYNTKLLKQAEEKQEEDLIDKYLKKCQDISQTIKKLTSK